MTIVRALHAETLKMKRTLAAKMVFIAPAVLVLLILFLVSQAPFSMLQSNDPKDEWVGLWRLSLLFWALLVMPLYITLQSALLASLDHSENQWKSLFARPIPRWSVYLAKLAVLIVMAAAGTMLLACGVAMDGEILPRLQSQLSFANRIPWQVILRECAQVVGLALLPLTLQHWVSLRWRSFVVATGIGVMQMVVGFFAVMGGFPQYIPSSLPMILFAHPPANITSALFVSCFLALVVVVAGCWNFQRREIQ